MWQPADHNTPWPEITEFFGRFDLKIFVGMVNRHELFEKTMHRDNTMESTFGNLTKIVFDHASMDRAELKRFLSPSYFSKIIYHEDPTGAKWHTPMVFHFDNATQKFYQTKGYKKLTVLELANITMTPVIIISDSKNVPLDGLRKAKHDQVLYDFLQETSGGICEEPTFGLEFWDFGQGLVPFLHKITIHPGTEDRVDYLKLYHQDVKLWARYRDRKILTDVPEKRAYQDRYYSQDRFETHKLETDLIETRKKFNQNTAAAIIAQRNPIIFLKLLNASVWLSTNAQGQHIGAWFSQDRRYGIVFNNQSDIVLELPPGIINN
jgi:hypothetical protein